MLHGLPYTFPGFSNSQAQLAGWRINCHQLFENKQFYYGIKKHEVHFKKFILEKQSVVRQIYVEDAHSSIF